MTAAAQVAGAFALVMSMALLCVGRAATAVPICTVQALLAAIVLAARGREPAAAACVAAALNGVALPLALRHLLHRPDMPTAIAIPDGATVSWVAAMVLLVASVAIFAQIAAGDALVVGSSVMLLGLLLMAQREHPLVPAFGLLSSQNGLLLVASAVPDLPSSALLVVATPLMPGLLVANTWLRP
jgi:hydrogenase-4 membrane subunit HyfE